MGDRASWENTCAQMEYINHSHRTGPKERQKNLRTRGIHSENNSGHGPAYESVCYIY